MGGRKPTSPKIRISIPAPNDGLPIPVVPTIRGGIKV